MNFIFEGCDNTFKTTTLNAVQKKLVRAGKETMRLNSSGIASVELTDRYYTDMGRIMHNEPNISFLVDRAWLGEEVYGPMYRNRKLEDIREFNRQLENNLTKNNCVIVYLYNDAEYLISHDDGLSFTTDLEKKKQELAAFEDAVDHSLCKVIKINVHDKTTEQIVEEIFENA